MLSIADFLAVLMLAGLGALIAAAATGETEIGSWPSWLPIESIPDSQVIPIVGGAATLLLVAKTLVAWRLTRRIYLFLARQEPAIAGVIFSTYIRAPFPSSQQLSRTEVGAAVGSANFLMSVLGASVSLIADAILLLLLTALMTVASPLLFLGSATYFVLLAFVSIKIVGKRSSAYAREGLIASLAASETTHASIGFASEIRLYGIADKFRQRLYEDQYRAATVGALQQVVVQAPRYVLEVGMMVGLITVATLAFTFQDAAGAAFTIALYAVSSARLIPAIQRINANWVRLRTSAALTLALEPILRLPAPETGDDFRQLESESTERPHTVGDVTLTEVGYRYPNSENWALQGINLTITAGMRVALVGQTGSGKSTLAQLIAGLIEPTTGFVSRNGGEHWRDELSFVPQSVYLAPDSVRNNVALPVLGQPDNDARIWEALELAQVDDVVAALPGGLDTTLGENGARLSGGEVQRIGLARALYRTPGLLILDEATSSLDAATENRVVQTLAAVSPQCTVVSVAHRLATVRDADLIVLLDEGRVVARGDFDSVAKASPLFANAAMLQGLHLADESGSTSPNAGGPNSRAVG